MKRPVRGDIEVSETQENQAFSVGGPDDQGSFGVNETGTVSESGTKLTQAGSLPVHPFASDIHALDCKLRNEEDGTRREILKADIAHLKNGTDRPKGKRFIGRQMAVEAGTYKPPQPKWLGAGQGE